MILKAFDLRSRLRPLFPPVTEISIFATQISVTGMNFFPYEHSSLGNRIETFRQNTSFALATLLPKWHNLCLVHNSTLGVCELALISKVTRIHKATTAANDVSLWFNILVVLLGLHARSWI